MYGAGIREQLDPRRWGAEEGAGEITCLRIADGKMVALDVSLDRGGLIECRGCRVPVDRFWEWFETLPIAATSPTTSQTASRLLPEILPAATRWLCSAAIRSV
eukprot:1529156-Rhodomonas_salina.1